MKPILISQVCHSPKKGLSRRGVLVFGEDCLIGQPSVRLIVLKQEKSDRPTSHFLLNFAVKVPIPSDPLLGREMHPQTGLP
jgi:hypothetical protein